MALSMQVILAGAMATHRIEQIEEQRRDLMRRHEDERAAISTEVQEIERLRAELEQRAQALQSSQQDLAARHESERDASKEQLQQANTEFVTLIDETVKQSGRKPEELTKLFNGQLEILIATGNLSEDVPVELPPQREAPARPRTERTYRRARKGQGDEATAAPPSNPGEPSVPTPAASPLDETQPPLATLDTDPVEPVSDEPPAGEPMAIEPEGSASEGPQAPRDNAEADAGDRPSEQPLRSIADEGGAIDDAVAALVATPATVVLTDADREPALSDHFFADIQRDMPPAAVSGREAALPTETQPTTADTGPDLGLDDGPDLGTAETPAEPEHILDLDLPGQATAAPAAHAQPEPNPDDLDEFDRLERDFGGKKPDVDFEIPRLLR